MINLLRTLTLVSLLFVCVINFSCNSTSAQTTTKSNFKEYKIILQEVNPMSPNSEESFKTFETKVKSALNDGWTLMGGAVDLGGYISQTVAK